MEVKSKKIGFVLTGSFCTFSKTIPKMKELKKLGADIIPIMSYNSYELDTKFGGSKEFIKQIEEICNKKKRETLSTSNLSDNFLSMLKLNKSLANKGFINICWKRLFK